MSDIEAKDGGGIQNFLLLIDFCSIVIILITHIDLYVGSVQGMWSLILWVFLLTILLASVRFFPWASLGRLVLNILKIKLL